MRSHLGLGAGREDLQDPAEAAEVKRAAADMKDAEQKYLRAKSLLGQGLLPQGTFDEAEARYNSARAAYELAVQSVQTLRAQLSQHRSAVAVAHKKRSDAVIRAPFAGQVKERAVTAGQYLKVQSPVMVTWPCGGAPHPIAPAGALPTPSESPSKYHCAVGRPSSV